MVSPSERVKLAKDAGKALADLEAIKSPLAFEQRNLKRREIHAHLELLEMETGGEEGMSKYIGDEDLAALRSASAKLEACSRQPEPLTKARTLIRLVLFSAWILFGSLYLILLSPIRLTHPILRRIGLKNCALPFDLMPVVFGKIGLAFMGVVVNLEMGDDEASSDDVLAATKELRDVPSLSLFSHASNLDPVILVAEHYLSCKFVAKRVLFMIPVFGWYSWMSGNGIAINRSNREKAITALKVAADTAMANKRCIAISPEGTRSKTGQIRKFKKGPFYLREDTSASLSPSYMMGAYELWPPGRPFTRTGNVTLRLLPPLRGEDLKGKSKDEVSATVRRMFLESSMKQPRRGMVGGRLNWSQTSDCVLKSLLGIFLMSALSGAIWNACITWGTGRMFLGFIAVSVVNVVYVAVTM